ncbi:MAG: hypothetical protein Q7U68_01050, partial [Candidatus Roizmanbacteria bacterium]|nr:hypothetical protein [Candidatus Roizmanbacteria bacterium]
MNEENKQIIIMECSLGYSLSDDRGQKTASGDAQARLDEENLSILPKFGEALFLSLRDILEISEGDYKIHLTLTSKEKLTLFNLGYRYEDFLRVLSKLRNEILLKDMLMHETLRKSGVEAEFVYFDEVGNEKQRGKCEPRLYETALVVIPEKGELVRIPYSDILEIRDVDFTLAIATDFGEKFVFSKMGRQFDSITKTLSGLINELSLNVQSSLKELLPKSDPSIIRRAARLMKEGKAARRSNIESISHELWAELEKKLEVAGIKEEYDLLKSLAQKERMCIGLKRGLLGDLTGEYIWFLIPIYSTNQKEPGNAVAMESISGEGGGKATYFFRIVSRKDYPNFKSIEDLHREVDNFIKRMNRCMLAINFRREPIYLPDERLEEPQYQKYQFAIRKIPALQTLRQLFIGRVIHRTPEQWKKDVMDLLQFNVSAQNDSLKWTKGMDDENALFYVTKLNFNPQNLKDVSELAGADEIFKAKRTEGTIPPNSKVRLQFRSYCLDEGYPAPDHNEPFIFSYEMLDMPLFLKLMTYVIEHPELEQSVVQKLIWNLSKKLKFHELSETEQQLLLKIDLYADAEVNNYKYGRYGPGTKCVFDQNLPKEIVPQPIPETEIYAKPVKISGYSNIELEFYNPTPTPQVLKL